MNERFTVLLAGPGHETVIYQMQPAFLSDPRFTIAGYAQSWESLQSTLTQLKPDILVIQADVAPGPDALKPLLAGMQAWNGVATVILPNQQAMFKGVYESMNAVVRGTFVAPVSWTDIANLAYGYAMTARAQVVNASPALTVQHALSTTGNFGASANQAVSPLVTGTKRIAVLSQAGGAGASTIAENLAYELAARLSVRSLLFSFGLPPAAAAHFKLRYLPNLTEFFARPGKASIQSAIQRMEGLDILLGPEDSEEYASAARNAADVRAPNSIYSALLAAEDGSYGAMVMDMAPDETEWMTHPLLFANAVLLVYRPIMADLFALRHTLNILSRLGTQPREAIYLVLNQASEASSLTPRAVQTELSQALGWAPPIIGVIESDPTVLSAQEQRVPASLRSEKLARGIRQVIGSLFPGMERTLAETPTESRSLLRLPKFRLG
jgi:MinD-like ATPase involved in chromosome partitioning or flagellar assembly